MVFTKKTELKWKQEGLMKSIDLYKEKIDSQISVYNQRIDIYERNIQKKMDLINRIEATIAEFRKVNDTEIDLNDMVSVLSKCKDTLSGDIEITSKRHANSILEANNISLEIYTETHLP